MRRFLLPWSLCLLVACGGRTPLSTEREGDSSVGGRSAGDGGNGAGGRGNGSGARSSDGGSNGGGRTGSGAASSGGLAPGGAGGGLGAGSSSVGGTAGGGSPGNGGSPGGTGGSNTGGLSTGGDGSGGAPPTCSKDGDCIPPDACLQGSCEAGRCVQKLRDQDGDGFSDELCGGTDCNDRNPSAHPGLSEVCGDGSDNDCNGVSDCFDPVCRGNTDCGCVPSGAEQCGNGLDDDCDRSVDCSDADCVGTQACGCKMESCQNGYDDDCDGAIDCDDADCAQDEGCQCAALEESCSNNRDDDCDGRVDCLDPSCTFAPQCLCLVPREEVCADGRDNDCDGLVDCGDPQCFSHAACSGCSPESCASGEDEDCDGLVDCADPSCVFDSACPPRAESCNNERDDDLDGLTDCDDSDCSNTQVCLAKQNTCLTARRIEALGSTTYTGDTSGQLSNFRGTCGGDAGEAVFWLELRQPSALHLDTVGTSFDSNMYVRAGDCDAGRELFCDDDSGGSDNAAAIDIPLLMPGLYFIYVDGFAVDEGRGPDEGEFTLNVEIGPAQEICGDGIDNDGDGFQDCADEDCRSEAQCELCNDGAPAEPERGVERCTDGLDNDCDGRPDCEDDDCSASQETTTECCTGTDQNGNGIPDDFSCRCVDDDDCLGDQICYTSTLGSCGLPCDWFVGEVCPIFAPGSECNTSTGQCEF